MVEINEREGCHDFHFYFGMFFFFFLSSPILFYSLFYLLCKILIYVCVCVCVFSYLLSHSTILYSLSLPFIIFSSLLYFFYFFIPIYLSNYCLEWGSKLCVYFSPFLFVWLSFYPQIFKKKLISMKMITEKVKNYEMVENWLNCVENTFF